METEGFKWDNRLDKDLEKLKEYANIINGNGEDIGDISDDTDEILEDTSSIDKKTTLLIVLWVIDKIIMALLIILLGK